MTRRAVLAGLLAAGTTLLLPHRLWAQARGFAIDWQGEAVVPSLAALYADQVARVRALPIDPAILAFFAAQPIFVLKQTGEGSVTTPRGIFLTRDAWPPENPVLLHELCHRYQGQRLSADPKRGALKTFFDAERAAPHWPAQAYMYTNVREFFAMMASVVLSGRAARPPFTRAAVARNMPALYAWIVAEFGLKA